MLKFIFLLYPPCLKAHQHVASMGTQASYGGDWLENCFGSSSEKRNIEGRHIDDWWCVHSPNEFELRGPRYVEGSGWVEIIGCAPGPRLTGPRYRRLVATGRGCDGPWNPEAGA